MKLHRFITALAFVALTISLFSSGDSLRAYAEAAHQPDHASEGDVIHITTTPQEIATTTQDVPTGTGSSGDVIHITTTIPGATTAAQDATAQSTTSTSATSGTEAATTAPTATSTTVPTSPPAAEADYLRLGGSSRIDTACKIADELLSLSREEGIGGSGCMVIANGYNFPDALAGVSLAASFDAPIMLTGGKQLEASVLERIRALEPETVYILGGKSVVSQDIESYLTAMGAQTIRLYGEDRYATAIEICKSLPGDSDRLFVVSGENYPDALSVSPVAGICRAPIVFSNSKGELTPQAIMEKKLFTKSQYGGTFSQCLPLRYKDNLYGESGLYYHTGNAYGVLSLMSYNPYTGDGVVVITTGASAERDAQGIYQVCAKISEYMYRNVV